MQFLFINVVQKGHFFQLMLMHKRANMQFLVYAVLGGNTCVLPTRDTTLCCLEVGDGIGLQLHFCQVRHVTHWAGLALTLSSVTITIADGPGLEVVALVASIHSIQQHHYHSHNTTVSLAVRIPRNEAPLFLSQWKLRARPGIATSSQSPP